MFIDKLLYHKANAKLFLENNGIKLMVDMLTLAHLHTTRAYVPTQVRLEGVEFKVWFWVTYLCHVI